MLNLSSWSKILRYNIVLVGDFLEGLHEGGRDNNQYQC